MVVLCPLSISYTLVGMVEVWLCRPRESPEVSHNACERIEVSLFGPRGSLEVNISTPKREEPVNITTPYGSWAFCRYTFVIYSSYFWKIVRFLVGSFGSFVRGEAVFLFMHKYMSLQFFLGMPKT